MNIIEKLLRLPKGSIIKIGNNIYGKLSDEAYDKLTQTMLE